MNGLWYALSGLAAGVLAGMGMGGGTLLIPLLTLALGVGQSPLSLTDREEGGELDVPVEAPEERMTERLTLYQILQNLEERDRSLIQYRYFQGKTQTETAALLGMTQVQVSRREKKLLAAMRAAFNQ